ncbi:ABC transporter permease subunit [Oscillospiraceae bacterium MB08-C2-2]|nr:ABC transporter permease subunit [Oscillospiraceae bacterium MB08-C2-2]
MKDSITSPKPPRLWEKALAIALWLLCWYLASKAIKQEMLLASPVSVAKTLLGLMSTGSFWSSVAFSLSRVVAGFGLAFAAGILLAVGAYRSRAMAVFLRPFMGIINAAPMASYIILCLLFLSSRSLSICISFLMALPIMYSNVLTGLQSTDQKLLEMASAFGVPPLRQMVYIYFSQLMPFLVSACSLSLGVCWKSGISAEVIGLPLGSIGEQLYQAKIFVDAKTVLAWTVMVIAISFLLERTFLALLQKLASSLERM